MIMIKHVWALLDKTYAALEYSEQPPTRDDIYVAKQNGLRYVELTSGQQINHGMSKDEMQFLADYHHAASKDLAEQERYSQAAVHKDRYSQLMSLISKLEDRL